MGPFWARLPKNTIFLRNDKSGLGQRKRTAFLPRSSTQLTTIFATIRNRTLETLKGPPSSVFSTSSRTGPSQSNSANPWKLFTRLFLTLYSASPMGLDTAVTKSASPASLAFTHDCSNAKHREGQLRRVICKTWPSAELFSKDEFAKQSG